jgi:hypothetical protein
MKDLDEKKDEKTHYCCTTTVLYCTWYQYPVIDNPHYSSTRYLGPGTVLHVVQVLRYQVLYQSSTVPVLYLNTPYQVQGYRSIDTVPP